MLLKEIMASERPRERLHKLGSSALSDSELLAIILRSGGKANSVLNLASQILARFGGIKGLLNADFHQLLTLKNVGYAKACSIKALSEIALRMCMDDFEKKVNIKKPADVFTYMRKDFYKKDREHLYLISLDTRSNILSKDLLSTGTINETLVHPREVYRTALYKNAASVILVHNHPSNDPTPSNDDIRVTERVAKAGINMGIALVDHIIICDQTFASLKSLNLLKGKEV